MRSKASVQCAACGESRWGFAEAAYVRALLEPGEADLNEDRGVVEGFLRQLRVPDALRRRDGGNSGREGQREGLVISKGTVP
jgi:hypothetical protein